MKKLMAAALAFGLVLTGCASSSYVSLTFDVETGDSIKVELKTSGNDYVLEDNGNQFAVKEDDKNIIQGIFLTTDMYDQYEDSIMETGTILESDGYILYEYDGEAGVERNILLMIPDSETGVIMASLEDEEKVRDVYSNLSFSNESK